MSTVTSSNVSIQTDHQKREEPGVHSTTVVINPQPPIIQQIQNVMQPQNQSQTATAKANEVLDSGKHVADCHKFIPLDPEKEDEIDHIKWTGNFKLIFCISMLAMVFWVILLIFSWPDYDYEYCDYSADGYKKCSYIDSSWPVDCGSNSDCDCCYISDGCDTEGKGICNPYNDKTRAYFVLRVAVFITVLLFCWKLFKNVWRGIPLPKTSKSQEKSGFNINTILEKIYNLRINIRPCIECLICNRSRSDDNSVHEDFVYLLWASSLIIMSAELLVLEIPVQILNLISDSKSISLIAYMSIPTDILYILVVAMRRTACCERCMNHKSCGGKLRDYYPKHHKNFEQLYAGIMMAGAGNAMTGLYSIAFAAATTPETSLDTWLVCLNFYKGMYGILNVLARYFTTLFIFNNYYQKKNVSLRESLIIKDSLKKLFVWTLFKVAIKDDDKFIHVDEKRGSATHLRLDSRTDTGKEGRHWIATLCIGIFFLGPLMALSIFVYGSFYKLVQD
eukprot:539277_1